MDNLANVMKDRIEILMLVQSESGDYQWETERKRWASVMVESRRNYFSTVGVSARSASIVIRADPKLTLHQALRWKGQFLYPTSMVLDQAKDRQELKAAFCTPSSCQMDTDRETAGHRFPAILAEKYIGHDQMDLHAEVTGTFVLVTPKVVMLAPGSWVTVDGIFYRVLVPHELDEWKNEYEIRRREDC